MPAKVIVLCNKKGGVGKSTLAINIGAALSKRGPVLVIDADPQQSATKWSDAAPEDSPLPMAVMGYPQEKVHHAIRRVVDQFDFILIDTPPSSLAVSTVTRSALLGADLALVPVIPSPLDIWEAVSISELLAEMNDIRETGGVDPLHGRLVVNRLKPRTTLGGDVAEALGQLDLPMLETSIHEREAYKHAVLDGCTVLDLKGSAGRAASDEIMGLTREVLGVLNGEA